MIYFLTGANSYARSGRLAELKRSYIQRYDANSVVTFTAGEDDASQILASLVNLSLLNPQELIIVQQAAADAELWNALADTLPSVPDSKTVVLVDEPAVRAVRSPLVTATGKWLKVAGSVEKFEQPKSYQLGSWLTGEAKRRCVQLDSAAQRQLLALTAGSDNPQSRLGIELGKLALLPQPITAEAIKKYVDVDLSAETFSVFNYLILGDTVRARRLLNRQWATGVDANQFVGVLAAQLLALAATASGADVKVHPYQRDKMSELIQRLGGNRAATFAARRLSRRVARLDARLKNSSPEYSWPTAISYLLD